MMKKKGFGAIFLALAMMSLSSCNIKSSSDLAGNLEFTQNDLMPKAFKEVKVNVVADVFYTQDDGDNHEVRIDFSAVENPEDVKKLKENMTVVYRNGGVEIGLKGHLKNVGAVKEGKRPKIYITSPDLVKIDLEGVGSFNAETINSDQLEVDNEGVGTIRIKDLLANRISLNNEGVGAIEIERITGDDLDVGNEGVGAVKVGSFKGGVLKIDNEGVGKVEARVDCKSVSVSQDGVGGVSLSGTTRKYQKQKGGIGGINDGGLKVIK